jgi:hypothetical protein
MRMYCRKESEDGLAGMMRVAVEAAYWCGYLGVSPVGEDDEDSSVVAEWGWLALLSYSAVVELPQEKSWLW